MCCFFFPPLDSFMSCGLNFNVIVPKQHFQATTIPCCGSDEGDECRPWHSGNRRGEPRRPHLPYVIFAEVIRGEEEVQGIWERYNEVFFFFFPSPHFSLGGVFVSIYCGHVLRARHFSPPTPAPPVRFYAQRHGARLSGEIPKRTKEEAESVEGPRSG